MMIKAKKAVSVTDLTSLVPGTLPVTGEVLYQDHGLCSQCPNDDPISLRLRLKPPTQLLCVDLAECCKHNQQMSAAIMFYLYFP